MTSTSALSSCHFPAGGRMAHRRANPERRPGYSALAAARTSTTVIPAVDCAPLAGALAQKKPSENPHRITTVNAGDNAHIGTYGAGKVYGADADSEYRSTAPAWFGVTHGWGGWRQNAHPDRRAHGRAIRARPPAELRTRAGPRHRRTWACRHACHGSATGAPGTPPSLSTRRACSESSVPNGLRSPGGGRPAQHHGIWAVELVGRGRDHPHQRRRGSVHFRECGAIAESAPGAETAVRHDSAERAEAASRRGSSRSRLPRTGCGLRGAGFPAAAWQGPPLGKLR